MFIWLYTCIITPSFGRSTGSGWHENIIFRAKTYGGEELPILDFYQNTRSAISCRKAVSAGDWRLTRVLRLLTAGSDRSYIVLLHCYFKLTPKTIRATLNIVRAQKKKYVDFSNSSRSPKQQPTDAWSNRHYDFVTERSKNKYHRRYILVFFFFFFLYAVETTVSHVLGVFDLSGGVHLGLMAHGYEREFPGVGVLDRPDTILPLFMYGRLRYENENYLRRNSTDGERTDTRIGWKEKPNGTGRGKLWNVEMTETIGRADKNVQKNYTDIVLEGMMIEGKRTDKTTSQRPS